MTSITKRISALIFASAMTLGIANADTSISLIPTLEDDSAYTSLTYDEDGNISIVFNNPLGTGSKTAYYDWNSNTYKLTTASLDDYDIEVNYVYNTRITSSSSYSSGGFVGSYVSTTSPTSAQGGAIFNGSGVTFSGNILGDFVTNYASSTSGSAQGGAIYNGSKGTITNAITGNFIGNYAENETNFVNGGAIYNDGTINGITGDFIGNYASSSYYGAETAYSAQGGAIYNYETITGGVTGDFIGNSVFSGSSQAHGGAIYNSSSCTIDSITGDFIGNYASSTAIDGSLYGGYGGAIYNKGTITEGVTGDFISNYASGSYLAGGGAIYSHGSTMSSIDSDFIGNYAISSSGSAYGGAVYATQQSSIILSSTSGNDLAYVGNYATTSNTTPTLTADDDENGGFLYIFGSYSIKIEDWWGTIEDSYDASTVEFNTAENSSITIGDGTAGYDSIASYQLGDENGLFMTTSTYKNDAVIAKTGLGTLTVNSSMEYYTCILNVEEGTMKVNNLLGASEINIGTTDSSATLSLKVNTSGGNTLTSETLSTISFNNDDSVLKLIATTTKAGDYTLSANEKFSITDLDNVITYGGTFDGEDFTVTAAKIVTDSTSITDESKVTVKGSSSVVIGEASDVIISTSSVYDTATTAITISEAKEITSNVTADGSSNAIYIAISEDVSSDFTVLSSWDFDIDFTAEEGSDSVVVSFLVGEGLDLSSISLYHTNDKNETTDETSSIVSYEDGYLSFEANGFSSYTAITAVPEPSTYAMIFGGIALGLAMYRRRK